MIASLMAASLLAGDAGTVRCTPDDLPLPAWGPYTKQFAGVSHVADPGNGLRFDLAIAVGRVGAPAPAPNAIMGSGFHPWAATADLTCYAYRMRVDGDALVAEVAVAPYGTDGRLVRVAVTNHGSEPARLAVHTLAHLAFPAEYPPILAAPAGRSVWVHALDHAELRWARSRATDSLVPDGLGRGEERHGDAVGGSVLGSGFGRDAGDRVRYVIEVPQAIADAHLWLRYRAAADAELQAQGLATGAIRLPAASGFGVATVPVGDVPAGRHELTLVASGGAAIAFNGFTVVGGADLGQVTVQARAPACARCRGRRGLGRDPSALCCRARLLWTGAARRRSRQPPRHARRAATIPARIRESHRWRAGDARPREGPAAFLPRHAARPRPAARRRPPGVRSC
jgi:hypothetical protein